MPGPVSSNSSGYQPSASVCDPEIMSCAEAPVERGPVSVVTIPPVHVEGDAGARQLVKLADAARGARDCMNEGQNTARDCSIAVSTALLSVAAATAVLPAVGGFVLTTGVSITCGQSLRALYDCETE